MNPADCLPRSSVAGGSIMNTKPTTAFQQGRAAAAEGRQAQDNPYEQGTRDHAEWFEGWQFVHDFEEDGEIPTDA
jgi:ribosome modulation factor